MPHPILSLFVDGVPAVLLAAPGAIAPRSFVLGVIAVQITVESGRVVARVRAHRTGDPAPMILSLASTAVIHVALGWAGETPRLPVIVPPALDGAAARLHLFLDGAKVAEAVLPAGRLAEEPAPRAFGHVFCRWLRNDACEPGCDLTDFLTQPAGVKYQRLAHPRLTVGEVASYTFSSQV
ncbi:MAG: hypothetical protein EXR72_05870 [Myxococcales bacterium]|nr:hypothetical protein [Myxococcales bacterium]